LYLFFIAAQIPTVPGRLRVAFRFKSPLEGQFHHIVFLCCYLLMAAESQN